MMATGIDDSEIEELCQGLPLVLKDQLKKAAMRLNFSLKYIPVNENWNELLAIFRSECVGPWVKMMIDGQQQMAYVDSRDDESPIHEHDFKYSNLGPEMRELHEALLAIENFDPKNHDSKLLRTHIGVVNAGLSGHDQMERAKSRIRNEYIGAKYGTGKRIKDDICSCCDIASRTFDNYVKAIKKENVSQ